jgi:hypothetical protein
MMREPIREHHIALLKCGLAGLLFICAGAAPTTQPGNALPPVADFSHEVRFVGQQDIFGRNAIGDAIVITAVHGPCDHIAIGNTYQIDGAYTLASHDQAELAAYETATQPNEPHRQMVPGQSATIHKGSGTFTLQLKVEDPGCPHVSFYPATGGSSFAGEYFGTGEYLAPAQWQAAATGGR